MKSRKINMGIRFLAAFLLLLSILAEVWTALGIVYMVNEGYYKSGYSFYKTELCRSVTSRYANTVLFYYLPLTRQGGLSIGEKNALARYQAEFSAEKTNFLFVLTDDTGKVLLTNYTNNENYGYQEIVYHAENDGAETRNYVLSCYVRDPISTEDEYNSPYAIYQTLYSMRYTLVAVFTLSFLLAVSLFIYLMFTAGRRKGDNATTDIWYGRLPLDLFAVLLLIAGFLSGQLAFSFNLPGNMSYGFMIMLPVSVIVFLFSAAALAFFLTLAVQVKQRTWWRSTLIYRIANIIGRIFGRLFNSLPMIWKAATLIAGYLVINGFLSTSAFSPYYSSGTVFVWLLFNLAVFAAICFLLIQMKTIRNAGRQIAAGDFNCKIDTKNMIWDIKHHAEDLNNIRSGMSVAVEERLKSERLKTELITNVSHDLKTPLTSIISYIDLLKKEPIETAEAKEYIAVLDRQSSRLKKLTEDLLEASKAATGNITVTLEPTDLVELISQSVGEYAERFDAGRLETVFQTNREKAEIMADGKLLWRVIDNLMNNICKYSLAGTRVYITVDAAEDSTEVIFRNISRDPLNAPPDELMERFMRGDSSRSTDGSGLGLSIAKNLTELLGGSFELILEGDLFKTVLTFKSLH